MPVWYGPQDDSLRPSFGFFLFLPGPESPLFLFHSSIHLVPLRSPGPPGLSSFFFCVFLPICPIPSHFESRSVHRVSPLFTLTLFPYFPAPYLLSSVRYFSSVPITVLLPPQMSIHWFYLFLFSRRYVAYSHICNSARFSFHPVPFSGSRGILADSSFIFLLDIVVPLLHPSVFSVLMGAFGAPIYLLHFVFRLRLAETGFYDLPEANP